MQETLSMTEKERRRLVILSRVKEGQMTLVEAHVTLGITYRHTRRLYQRFKKHGAAGLIHKSRGKTSSKKTDKKLLDQVIQRYQERYYDFGPTLAAEKLAEEKLIISRDVLRRTLIENGLWSPQRKRAVHRTRRERRKRFGELLQLDGSHHDWFEGRREKACLMNLVDDATGRTESLLFEEETTEAAMRTLWHWIELYGVPEMLYSDWKNVYLTNREPTDDELLSGQTPLTAFGKACKKLGIKIIGANSPQAKGRVERNHGVYQDRFVKELRLQNISTIEEANTLLRTSFCTALNERFTVMSASSSDAHIPLPGNCDLRTIFCIEKKRVLTNDWVVRDDNRFYQVTKDNRPLPPARATITVCHWLDGTIHLLYGKQELRNVDITKLVMPHLVAS